jgi:hypothetical protein
MTSVETVTATAEFRLTARALVYYMYSWQLTVAPSADQIMTRRRVKSDAPQVFGSTFAANATTTGTETSFGAIADLTQLRQETDYILFYVFVGPDKQVSAVGSLLFTTKPVYQPVFFWVTTTVIVRSNKVKSAVLEGLALPDILVKYIGVDPNLSTTQGRLLQTSNTTKTTRAAPVCTETTTGAAYPFMLVMDPGYDLGDPQDLVKALDQKKSLMSAYLPELCQSVSISESTYVQSPDYPEFIYNPRVVGFSNSTVTVEAVLSIAGAIHAVVLEESAPRPSALQIVNGLDSTNTKVDEPYYEKSICYKQQAASLKFRHLSFFKRYTVWLAGTNDYPGYPTIMNDTDVRSLNFTAGKSYSPIKETEIFATLSDSGLWLWSLAALFALLV